MTLGSMADEFVYMVSIDHILNPDDSYGGLPSMAGAVVACVSLAAVIVLVQHSGQKRVADKLCGGIGG